MKSKGPSLKLCGKWYKTISKSVSVPKSTVRTTRAPRAGAGPGAGRMSKLSNQARKALFRKGTCRDGSNNHLKNTPSTQALLGEWLDRCLYEKKSKW